LMSVAISVFKRGRWCIVGKVTKVNGVWSFVVIHRHQTGTVKCVSIPDFVLKFAKLKGCQWFYYIHDRPPKFARRVMLDAIGKAIGWFNPNDGEFYIPLYQMEDVPFPRWDYAERVIKLMPNLDYEGDGKSVLEALQEKLFKGGDSQ